MSQTPPGSELTCPTCAAPVAANATFCTACGSLLPAHAPLAPTSAAAQPEVPWRGWEAILVWLLGTVTGAVIAFFASLVMKGDGLIAFSLIVVEGSLGAWVLLWVRIRHGLGPAALGLRADEVGGDVQLGLAAGAGGLLLQFILLPLVTEIGKQISGHPVKAPQQIALSSPSAAALVATGLAVIVVAPLAEELFFRGFLYQGLRRRFGITMGAITSAAVFGLAHVYPLLYLPIGALGYILARVFERRRSLLPNVIGHGLFNAVGFTVIVLSRFR